MKTLSPLLCACLCLQCALVSVDVAPGPRLALAAQDKAAQDAKAPSAKPDDPDPVDETDDGDPTAPATTGAQMSLEEAFAKIAGYKFGDSRQSLDVISDAVRASAGKPDERAQLAKRLNALLSGASTTDAKRFACRQLWIVGTVESVPLLAPLLRGDEELAHMARYALERLQFPEAAAALRDALGEVQSRVLIGVINSLGERRDAGAVDAIAKHVDHADPAIAGAAVLALAKIGGAPAGAALAAARAKASPQIKTVVTEASLHYASGLAAQGEPDQAAAIYQELYAPTAPKSRRLAALRGLVTTQGEKAVPLVTEVLNSGDPFMEAAVAGFVRDLPAATATAAFAGLLPKLSPGGQAELLDALSTRAGETAPEVRAATLAAVQSQHPAVRVAAVRALAHAGDASAVPVLAGVVASGTAQETSAALATIDRLRGAGVDAAIMASLQNATPKVRAALLRSLGTRQASTALPTFMRAVEDADSGVRLAAFNALAAVATEKDMPALLNLMARAKTGEEQTAAEKMIVAATAGIEGEKRAEPLLAALPGASMAVRQSLLRAIGGIGGEKAREALQAALNDPSADIQDTAIRTLAKTTDVEAAPTLLNLARTAARPLHKVLALQGYTKLAGSPGFKAPARQRMYQDAMSIAQRPEEKRAILAGISDAKTGVLTVDALNWALPFLEDAAIKEEAAAAVMGIVQGLPKDSAEAARAATQKVLEVSKEERVRKQATEFLAKASQGK